MGRTRTNLVDMHFVAEEEALHHDGNLLDDGDDSRVALLPSGRHLFYELTNMNVLDDDLLDLQRFFDRYVARADFSSDGDLFADLTLPDVERFGVQE